LLISAGAVDGPEEKRQDVSIPQDGRSEQRRLCWRLLCSSPPVSSRNTPGLQKAFFRKRQLWY